MEKGIVLMNSERVNRSVQRMACEIAEQHSSGSPVLLFGIGEGGYAVARMLAKRLIPVLKESVEVVRLFDDSTGKVFKSIKANNETPVIFVVDDVIFSGQTMFRALTEIANNLQPSEIHTVALVDRGHRKFPVKAEFYGMMLLTKLNEYVSIEMKKGQISEVFLSNKRND